MRFALHSEYIQEDRGGLPFTVHPDVYTDPEIFESEMTNIFNKSWSFLTLESQIVHAHDFVTCHIGDTPILVTRNGRGEVGAFINTCPHKGSVVCGLGKGNARIHICPYHAWSFSSSGELVAIRDLNTADYTDAFKQADHGLTRIARIESYRGFLFGSLSVDVPPLTDFLGGMRAFLDMIVDRYPQGLEIVSGSTAYTYRGNWKLQLENGMDSYHLNTAHKTFVDILGRRRMGQGNTSVKEVSWKSHTGRLGIYSFEHGHTLVWVDATGSIDRPDDLAAERASAGADAVKAEWMKRGRNYYFFPNMQIQDTQSLMIRVFRPVAVDRTEMSSYCLAPIGEDDDAREWRLRQYEDFFNVGGLATPDDSIIYEWCQEGFRGANDRPFQGFVRGASLLHRGGDAESDALGVVPVSSYVGPFDLSPEIGAIEPFRVWARMLDGAAAAGSVA